MAYFRNLVLYCFIYASIVLHIGLITVFSCPSGFDFQFLSSCYYIVTKPQLSRPNSQEVCESRSSHLLFIESESEKDYLSKTYNRSYQYWLGANGVQNGTFTWDDGSVMAYHSFTDHGFTFDDETGCYRIAVDIGQGEYDVWYDSPCGRKYSYICEYELGKFYDRSKQSFLLSGQKSC